MTKQVYGILQLAEGERDERVAGSHWLHRNVQQFRGGLVFKAHRLLYHSTLGLRIIQKKEGAGFGLEVPGLSPASREPVSTTVSFQ